MDLSSYSLSELRDLEILIKKEIQQRAHQTSRLLLERFEEFAQAEGLNIADVLKTEEGQKLIQQAIPQSAGLAGTRRGMRQGTAVVKDRLPPVYFHPTDPSIGWSGRGRTPDWVKNWESENRDREELRRTPV
jgi:DNA-binding protein H-NS